MGNEERLELEKIVKKVVIEDRSEAARRYLERYALKYCNHLAKFEFERKKEGEGTWRHLFME